LDEPVAVGEPVLTGEDVQNPKPGRDKFGDERLVGVGRVAGPLTAVGESVQLKAEGLVDAIGLTPTVGYMAKLTDRATTLQPRLGRGGRTVELLQRKGKDIDGEGVTFESVDLLLPLGELSVAFAELLPEFLVLLLDPLETL
jgi:hypothetical protein